MTMTSPNSFIDDELITEQAIFVSPGKIEIRSVALSLPESDSTALISPILCGICAFERSIFLGLAPIYPSNPGHEFVGRVMDIRGAIPGFSIGDLVTADLLTRCGECSACSKGKSAACKAIQGRLRGDGTIWLGGALSRVMRVDSDVIHPLGSMIPEVGVFAEPMACVVNSLRRAELKSSNRVLVIGAGLMGLLHVLVCVSHGVSEISVVDINPDRLRIAERLGATNVNFPDESKDSADVVFLTMGTNEAAGLAVKRCDAGGTVVVFGVPGNQRLRNAPLIDLNEIHSRELSVIGAYSHEQSDWNLAVELLADRRIATLLPGLITSSFPFEDVEDALEASTLEGALKVVVSFN